LTGDNHRGPAWWSSSSFVRLIPMAAAWATLGASVLMMAFVCQLRVHIKRTLQDWLE
jgi:hypothetical protein